MQLRHRRAAAPDTPEPWLENNDAIAADTSSPAAATTAVVGIMAAAWAAVSDEPMPATSDAADDTNSGAAITNDIRYLHEVRATRRSDSSKL